MNDLNELNWDEIGSYLSKDQLLRFHWLNETLFDAINSYYEEDQFKHRIIIITLNVCL